MISLTILWSPHHVLCFMVIFANVVCTATFANRVSRPPFPECLQLYIRRLFDYVFLSIKPRPSSHLKGTLHRIELSALAMALRPVPTRRHSGRRLYRASAFVTFYVQRSCPFTLPTLSPPPMMTHRALTTLAVCLPILVFDPQIIEPVEKDVIVEIRQQFFFVSGRVYQVDVCTIVWCSTMCCEALLSDRGRHWWFP